MANFEGLIRGAIAAKGALTAKDRADIYQSSRNALRRLIDNNRSMTLEAAIAEQQALESAIEKIEREYQTAELAVTETIFSEPPAPQTMPVDAAYEAEASELSKFADGQDSSKIDEVNETTDAKPAASEFETPSAENDPFYEIQQVLRKSVDSDDYATASEAQDITQFEREQLKPEEIFVATPPSFSDDEIEHPANEGPATQQVEEQTNEFYAPNPPDEYDEPVNVPPAFVKRRHSQKILLWIGLSLTIIAVLIWISYRLFLSVIDGSIFAYQDTGQNGVASITGNQTGSYITILEPGDLTSLEVSEAGRVEIINVQNLEFIRILSVRDRQNREESAKPILLKLKPGVLQEIIGKRVTVEIFAKSGTSRAAQFAVECLFDQGVGCGRKRFHIGVQPEVSIFAFTLEADTLSSATKYIAINTDITDNASVTGEGDILDIVYVRLRTQ